LIELRIKVPPHARRTTGTWSAMKNERGPSGGSTARFPINLMPIADIEHAVIVWFNVGI
jgi:hypothetical protein